MLIRKHGHKIALSIIIVFQLIVAFSFASKKQGFFIDEIFSYSLANSFFKEKYSPTWALINKWNDPDYFNGLVVASKEHRFAYRSVIFNQSKDVHPPLYYLVLHTICSFFPENFSKWYGLTINFILFIISSIFLYLISNRIFNDSLFSLVPNIVWGFSSGAISTVIFIRMYMLLTTIILIFFYLHLNILTGVRIKKTLILLSIFTFLGFMTHYYFLIFAFFLTFSFSITLIIKKAYLIFTHYLISLIVGVLVGLLAFPSSVNHIFNSYRGYDAIKSLSNTNEIPIKLETMFSVVSRQQFNGFLLVILIMISCLFTVNILTQLVSRYRKNNRNLNYSKKPYLLNYSNQQTSFFLDTKFFLLSVLFPVIASFIIISIISPYSITRYAYFLYPILSLVTVYMLHESCQLLINKKYVLVSGILILFIVINTLSYKQGYVDNIYSGYSDILTIAKNNRNVDCVYITNRTWIVEASIFELREFRNVYLLPTDSIAEFTKNPLNLSNKNSLIIYIDNNEDQDKVLSLLLEASGFNESNLIYTQDHATTYYMH